MTTTDEQTEAQALAQRILAKRQERAARRDGPRAPPPVAIFQGQPYPLGTPVWDAYQGRDGAPVRIGVIAGVCLAQPDHVIVAAEWHPGAPAHRYEGAQPQKQHTLGASVYPTWAGAWHRRRLTMGQSLSYLRERTAVAERELAALDALKDPTL